MCIKSRNYEFFFQKIESIKFYKNKRGGNQPYVLKDFQIETWDESTVANIHNTTHVPQNLKIYIFVGFYFEVVMSCQKRLFVHFFFSPSKILQSFIHQFRICSAIRSRFLFAICPNSFPMNVSSPRVSILSLFLNLFSSIVEKEREKKRA